MFLRTDGVTSSQIVKPSEAKCSLGFWALQMNVAAGKVGAEVQSVICNGKYFTSVLKYSPRLNVLSYHWSTYSFFGLVLIVSVCPRHHLVSSHRNP